MKLSRTAFTLAVAMADKVIVPRSTLPVLECVCLTPLPGERLQVVGTDLDTSVLLELPYTGEPIKAPVALKAKGLLKLLKTLDAPTIELSSNTTTVDAIGDEAPPKTVTTAVKIDGINLPANGTEDFPDIQKPTAVRSTLPGLSGAMEFCLPGMSHDESRWALNSIALEVEKKEAWVASSDGHRLYRAWIPVGQALGMLVPRRLVELLLSGPGKKLMRRDEILTYKDGIAVPLEYVAERMTGIIMTRALDPSLKFPNVEAVTPHDDTATTTIDLPRESTLKLLTRAIALTSHPQTPIDLVVKLRPGAVLAELKIHVRNEDDGSSTLLDVPAVVAGNDVVLGINGQYLKKALEAMTSEKILLHIANANSPVWLAEGTKSKKALPASWQGLKRSIVIMPMRTAYTGKVVDGVDGVPVEALPVPAPTTA